MLLIAATAAALASAGESLPLGFISPPLLTWTGLLLFVVVLMLWGKLIPKSTHEREISILEKRVTEVIAERDEWRAASRASDTAAHEIRMQNRMLLEQGQTTAYALDQIRVSLGTVVGIPKNGAPT